MQVRFVNMSGFILLISIFMFDIFCAGPVSDDEIRHMYDLEGESVTQRRLRIQIADGIMERMSLIKVPASETWPELGDSDAQMAKFMFQRAMRAAFSSDSPSFLDYATRMNNFLAGLASADINPRPFVESIRDLGRRLIRIEVLEEARYQRLNSNATVATQELKQQLDAAKRNLAEAQEASRPLILEREKSLEGVAALEENIRQMERALADLRNNLAAMTGNVARLDEQLAKVEQDAVTQADAVQTLESHYIQSRRLMDRHASESEFIHNVISADLRNMGEEVAKLI
jgi:hypothetical protein